MHGQMSQLMEALRHKEERAEAADTKMHALESTVRCSALLYGSA